MSDDIDGSASGSTESPPQTRVGARDASRKRWAAPKVIGSQFASTAGGVIRPTEAGSAASAKGTRPTS
jgi:hypothetical protein